MNITPKRTSKYNNMTLGLILGLLLPALVFVLVWAFSDTGGASLRTFFMGLKEGQILTNILSLCTLADLLLFYMFLRKRRYQTVRGIILAVFLIALWVIFTKISLF
jgi:hypothetical protein